VNAACHALAAAGAPSFVPYCGSCHPIQIDVHGYDAIDHIADDVSMDGAVCSDCHALDLSEEHEKASSSSTGVGCATCHPTPRDTLAAWDQSCATGGCHTAASSAPMHEGIELAHEAVDSQECVNCHETSDLPTHHEACTACHNDSLELDGLRECVDCHGDLSPTDPNHYPSSAHYAYAEGGCRCHSKDLYTEHQKYDVGCVDCHQTYVDDFTSEWNTQCAACHPSKHGAKSGR
jgi:hypothetical protein